MKNSDDKKILTEKYFDKKNIKKSRRSVTGRNTDLN
jgi:hypothetical protein